MKKKFLLRAVLLSVSLACTIAAVFYFNQRSVKSISSTDKYEEKEGEEDAFDNPIARAQYEFEMVKDPATGKIPEGVYEQELEQARQIFARQQAMRVTANTYTFQGPNNLGGRTRAIVFDVRYNGTTNQTIFAGGVSGGIFKSTDNAATWTRTSPTNQHFSTTSIAQDPRPGFQDIWYYSTGEPLGNSAGATGATYFGNGVYKSIDNGETWTRLANSNTGALETFDRRQDMITKVAVNPANGDVYMAALGGIYRSQDGGTTWSASPVLTSGAASWRTDHLTDIVITSTGSRLYAAFSGASCTSNTGGCPTLNTPGVWTSTTGDAGSWTKIAGDGAAANPGTWDPTVVSTFGDYGRVVLALAPSNQDILYAAYDNYNVNPAIEAEFFKWDQSLGTWVDRSPNLPDEPGSLSGNDPFAIQGGYDLVVAVKPDNPDVVFLGGTNIYRSTDGFATTGNTTRIGGYNSPANYALYPNSHPDIHSIVFPPTGPATTMLCGNDGGIQRTSDNLAAPVVWTQISTGFRTYQYYDVAIDPRIGNTKVLGGAQDNGSTRNIGGGGTSFEMVYGGDGVSVGLTNVLSGNTYELVGSQSGDIRRRNSLSGLGATTNIRPNTASDNGLFVTEFLLDPDNTNFIYYASDSSLYRNTSVSTATTLNWTNLTGVQTTIVDGLSPKTRITSMAVTRGTYDPATASLFIGTNERRIYRLDDPANVAAATAPVNISSASFPAGGYISSIAVNPRNDDTVLLTFSNYNVFSVWWTGNANSATPTWVNVEGNLTLPSFRSSAIAIADNTVQYFVGTSAGLFNATINGASPATTTWTQEGATEIGNAVVSSLALRTNDNRLLAGTHGYGMWATSIEGAGLPVNFTSFTGKVEDKQNRLFWKVENEVDNKGYEIERKYKHETNFTKIGFIAAKSANAAANDYTFPDGLVDLGIDNVSYRLKQVDIDGDFMYSATITLNRKVSGKFVEYIAVWPNSLMVRLNGQNNQPLTFRLFDNSGKLVQQKQLQNRTQEISLSGMPRGVLVVELSLPDGKRHVQKIVR